MPRDTGFDLCGKTLVVSVLLEFGRRAEWISARSPSLSSSGVPPPFPVVIDRSIETLR